MKVLLIYPNFNREIIGWGDLGAIAEPLALEYLAAAARQDGHDVQILDLRLRPRQLDSTLLGYKPEVVCATGYSMHVLRNLAICKRAKELLPACRTVVGGHHATLLPEDFFAPQIDFIVTNDGIDAFRRILGSLKSGNGGSCAPDTWSRVGESFEFGGDAPPLEIDSIPFPDRTLVGRDRAEYYIDWMRPIALFRTSVGCPYRCSFCSLWKIMDGRYHTRHAEAVLAELRQIPEPYVFLVDDEPFVNRRRMEELAECIERAGIHKQYFAYCRIDSFLRNLDLMKIWRKIGLRRLFFGIETIFEAELEDYNKRLHFEQIVEGLRVARNVGISIFSNFIIKPEYTAAEFNEIVEFVRRYDVEYPSFTILTPIPGTEWGSSFDHVRELQPNGRPNWDYFDLQHPVTDTKLPKDEFMGEYRNLQRVFASAFARAGHPFFRDARPEAYPGTGAAASFKIPLY